jgi:hypothetical protein
MPTYAACLPACLPAGVAAGLRNLWGSYSRFAYAACEYSLINPFRIGRRWTLAAVR